MTGQNEHQCPPRERNNMKTEDKIAQYEQSVRKVFEDHIRKTQPGILAYIARFTDKDSFGNATGPMRGKYRNPEVEHAWQGFYACATSAEMSFLMAGTIPDGFMYFENGKPVTDTPQRLHKAFNDAIAETIRRRQENHENVHHGVIVTDATGSL